MKVDLRKAIREIIYEELAEISSTGTGASFTSGTGEQYATPKAFSKKHNKDNKATTLLKKTGYTKVSRPKRPSHTKLFDYLQEGEVTIDTMLLNKKVEEVMKSHFSWIKTVEERQTIKDKIKDAFTQAYKLKGFTIKEDN
jgi:hypothetical protein